MTTAVSDVRSNAQNQIAHFAKALGRSEPRIAVFKWIHTGRQRIKTATHLAREAGLDRRTVLNEAKKLVHRQVVTQTVRDGEVAYERDNFCYANRDRIIKLARSPKKLKAFPTSYSPSPATVRVTVKVPKAAVKTKVVTVDDIDSFSKVRRIRNGPATLTMSEQVFKKGVQKLIGQVGTFKDWGGETSDLYSTRLRLDGVRKAAAFAFKGKGLTGTLTPARMGKNGDQIQRLFIEDADVFILQYGGAVANSVPRQMAALAQTKSLATGRLIRYGILDGEDSARLVAAYPRAFRAGKRKEVGPRRPAR